MSGNLAEIAKRHGTDKGTSPGRATRLGFGRRPSPKGYTATYERFIGPRQEQELRLLEIGVYRGASLRMWEDYLPNATINGIDINPRCSKYASARSVVQIGSQTDRAFLETVAAEAGPFDVIVDDGSHLVEHHHASLEILWPHVAPGGMYVIEDMHTSYMPRFGGGLRKPGTTMETLKDYLDGLMGFTDEPLQGLDGMWFAKGIAALFKAN